MLTGNRSLADEADVFIFHMDYWNWENKQIEWEYLPPYVSWAYSCPCSNSYLGDRKQDHQLYALYGHEPTWKRNLWTDASFVKV